LTETQIDELLDGVAEDQVGLSITAKAGMNPESYGWQIERRWSTADSGAGGTTPARQ
jgi:hypothetical protein